MAQLEPVDGTDVFLWKYLPSLPLAAVSAALFTIATAALAWRIAKSRLWFCIPFAVGGAFQIIGFSIRIAAHYYTNEIAPFVLQSIFILLAPVLYAASIYTVLGRLIRSVRGDRHSIVQPKWMTLIFVTGDFVALNVQGNAAGLTAKDSTRKIGEYIIIAGLFIQLILFAFFIIAASIFHIRMRKDIDGRPDSVPEVPWERGLQMIYACSALIMSRSLFRAVEYIMGGDGYLLSTEWPMYALDTAPMLLVQIISVLWFPDKFSGYEKQPGMYMALLLPHRKRNAQASEDGQE
ncbi:hypothetical protein jhhlp_004254 [Lomentospora prolificans]|uniref:RTA1 like protein n=1 Tax=Lomentospora prolificans TaxID=41688 RepID=A0A2N3NB00_9PEZI|nr:hypothetical protein jhhlp_004254 [Lomentospora prolificans]